MKIFNSISYKKKHFLYKIEGFHYHSCHLKISYIIPIGKNLRVYHGKCTETITWYEIQIASGGFVLRCVT